MSRLSLRRTPTPPGEEGDPGTIETRGGFEREVAAERVWYLLATLAAVVVVFAAGVAGAAVSPTFCGACHQSEVRALAASPHQALHCDSCHMRSGVLGLIENRLNVVSMVAAAPLRIVGAAPAAPSGVDRRNCVKCHGAMLPQTIQVDGIRMNHAAPQKAGWSCERCHAGAAHAEGGEPRISYTMDQCLGCHTASQRNLASCDVCHTSAEGGDRRRFDRVTPWRVTHGSNWRKTHGMGDLETCKTCHASAYCESCHGIPMPHPPDFMSTHGSGVIEDGRETCVTCHQPSSCDSCHGVEMPHPDGFLAGHKKSVAADGDEVCERCHSDSTCRECHERHTHPGIPQDKLRRLRETAVSR